MLRSSGQTLSAIFLGSDLLLTAAAWMGAYLFRFRSGLVPVYRDVPDLPLCLRLLPAVLVLAAAAYRLAGQYQAHRLRRLREEVAAVLKGVGLMSLLVMATIFYRQDPYESRATMLIFSAFAAGGVLAGRRLAWWGVHFLRRRGYNQSLAVVVGTGRGARRTARALRRAAWMGIRVVGFVEDNPSRWSSDLHILGTTAELPELIRKYRLGHVFIALPLGRMDEARRAFDRLSQELVEVRLVADTPGLAGLSLTTTYLDGLPVIGLRESPHFGLNVLVKRAMDVTLAGLGLLAISPLLALIAVLVRLTSPGPVLYRQERCGLNGRPFGMLKFRTMRADAEAATGPVWAAADDGRRTRLGAFLRRTNLDELPQLWNVLKGDMSLVGPRPERPHFIGQFKKTIPSYMARHRVKCGITGWAQVNGWRGNTSLRKRIQYDLYYITHWSPWLDLSILVRTVLKMLAGKQPHAY